MSGNGFRATLKAALFTTLFAAAILPSSSQSYSREGSPPPSPSPAPSQGMMSAETQLSGSIATISGATIFVTLNGGSARAVTIDPKALVLARETVGLDAIRPGDALGVAAQKSADGSLRATAINVFAPEIWQRVRKGQFPMADGQVMTNAQVERVDQRVEGQTLYMKYEMLSVAIAVPPSASIKKSVVGSLGDLAPGMKVAVRGRPGPNGIFVATFLSFDRP